MEPTFRFGTHKAIQEVAKELNLPYFKYMQDWAYEVSDPADIERYIVHYHLTTDKDKKFVLMEMILQAIVNQPSEERLLICWEKVSPLLNRDFETHEFTIAYWISFADDNTANCAILGLLLKKLRESAVLNRHTRSLQ